MKYFIIWLIGICVFSIGSAISIGPAPVTSFIFSLFWTHYIIQSHRNNKNKENNGK
jgi:hypothetical protein